MRWPEDVPWEKCHLRPSRQGKDYFAKDPDNLKMMSPALHKAFDGSGGSLASIIIEPPEVVLPSTDSTSGTVSVRVYFKDNQLLNSLLVVLCVCSLGSKVPVPPDAHPPPPPSTDHTLTHINTTMPSRAVRR